MKRREVGLAGATFALLLLAAAKPALAVDSISAEVGNGNKTQMLRIGAQWNWERRWWQSESAHLGGYWDLTLAQWRANRYQDTERTQYITDVGITPVFRYQSNSGKGMYGELGIGAHLFSHLYNNNGRRLSTSFQFGDHLAAGYVFSNGLDLGLKFQHFSNGGIKQPNNGVNLVLVRVGLPF